MGRNGSSSDYCRVESLYQEALDLPAERRLEFLRTACNGNRRLQREVETLLEHYGAAGEEYLAKPVFGRADAASTPTLPERIGRYDIIHVLGQGGMGTVYEAQQRQPKRRVAIKVLRCDLASDHMLKRFQQEIEVLGQLRHPGIAQIHEAGIGDVWYGGVRAHTQPFFAMELIRGQPLTEYASAKHPNTRTRLQLFLRVCDAVQHAHQNGVIHRDLKPANRRRPRDRFGPTGSYSAHPSRADLGHTGVHEPGTNRRRRPPARYAL
ncbi:MAG: serine/threonine-protein kinase [Planctomycetota bacterium]